MTDKAGVADRAGTSWCVFPSLVGISWLEAGVTTRNGASLAAMVGGKGSAVASPRQVHGVGVIHVQGPPRDPGGIERGDGEVERWRFPEADALMTRMPGVAIRVSTADCVPVLVVDPEHRAIGAAHAGWRGLAGGVITELARAMREVFDTRPEHSRAVLGPAIGPCCYPVGEEVVQSMNRTAPHAVFHRMGDRPRLDLWATGEEELRVMGFPASAIESLRVCTACHPELFFSRRRDGAVLGQMYGFALIRAS